MAVVASASYRQSGRYLAGLASLAGSLGALLLTVVEMRRALLFPLSDYATIGAPSAILYFNRWHLPLLALGALGVLLSYRHLLALDADRRTDGGDLRRLTRWFGVGLFALLIVDLFVYRGVPASRIAAAGKTSVGQAIPLDAFGGWLRPLGEGINYLALVWHATTLGILIGALFLTLVASLLKGWVEGRGFRSHLAGAVLAIGHPFCSCCAAPVGASLYRSGAGLGPTLAFVVSSPMLNPTSVILALALLPADFALLRIGGGAIVGILVTYLASAMASRWARAEAVAIPPSKLVEVSARVLEGFSRLFLFEAHLGGRVPDSPGMLLATWLSTAWRLGRVVVPVLFLSSVATSAIVAALPSPTNNPAGILVAAAFGTLLMVPTWTEIPIALGLLRQGLTGPAAALLLTLPAVSVPCLVILGAATANYRAALLLGLLAFGVGALAGIWFLVV